METEDISLTRRHKIEYRIIFFVLAFFLIFFSVGADAPTPFLMTLSVVSSALVSAVISFLMTKAIEYISERFNIDMRLKNND